MTKPWRESVTCTEQPDGTIRAKLHGYDIETQSNTYAEALSAMGAFLDECSKGRKDFIQRYEATQ